MTAITKEEQKAIKSLERLMKKWPDDLILFGWAGTLCVMKRIEDGRNGLVTTILEVTCDGGDPSDAEVDQDYEFEYD